MSSIGAVRRKLLNSFHFFLNNHLRLLMSHLFPVVFRQDTDFTFHDRSMDQIIYIWSSKLIYKYKHHGIQRMCVCITNKCCIGLGFISLKSPEENKLPNGTQSHNTIQSQKSTHLIYNSPSPSPPLADIILFGLSLSIFP